jgi:hypothetical protein
MGGQHQLRLVRAREFQTSGAWHVYLQDARNQSLPQPHNPAVSIYASHPHSPQTPTTPNNPASMGGSAPPPPQTSGRGSYPMMHSTNQPQQFYVTSSAKMPQAFVPASHSEPIAPATCPGGQVPPSLRPVLAGGIVPRSGLASSYAQSAMMSQPSNIQQENGRPHHVVGSSGRSGILPSAPGRRATNAQIPQKDANGKFVRINRSC